MGAYFDKVPEEGKTLRSPFAYVDNARFGHIEPKEYANVDSSLTRQDIDELSRLNLTTRGVRRLDQAEGMRLKSMHRTSGIDLAMVHLGWGGKPVEQDEPEWFYYHIKDWAPGSADGFRPMAVTPNTISFWKKQAQLIELVEQRRA